MILFLFVFLFFFFPVIFLFFPVLKIFCLTIFFEKNIHNEVFKNVKTHEVLKGPELQMEAGGGKEYMENSKNKTNK